ncbi:UTP--glucose-1-phosphate uridylyltransferase-like [Ctenocephalides felis]|uniref:UTP--glucose-1-phosphate uridylyltransferase-like n=1 Tax=Ctenocephalides felis TaxID=7515 RepID=UPI000E6E3A04|nr:UTP--glucose-1-phosphate uridylyltransferase-like [Ctenocephalides felis]
MLSVNEQDDKKLRGHQRAPSGSREFRELTKRDALVHLRHELDRLLRTVSSTHHQNAGSGANSSNSCATPTVDRSLDFNNVDEHKPSNIQSNTGDFAPSPSSSSDRVRQLDEFAKLYERFLLEDGPSVDWEKIEKLPENAVLRYDGLPSPAFESIRGMLEKLVVVKLNGGLGTSMGCYGPKSVITVRSDLTFLDLTVQQIEYLNKTYNCNVPLVLMNSFNTDSDTEKVIRKYRGFKVEIHTFNQSCFPRINRDTLLPIAKNCDIQSDMEAWYPPGHGDFYKSFCDSGLLKRFIESGREYCFLSNIDNLGATVDLNILNHLLRPEGNGGQESPEFVMEVTDKTRADVKGGTLIQYEEKLRLLEIAQVPPEHIDEFKSVKTFKFFNTNNLWVKLDAIDRVLNEHTLNMEIIINTKHLDSGENVIQLETAVGAAMKSFDRGIGINVPRSRFLPVKKTSDLLLVMSNLYNLKNGTLVMSPLRMFPTTPLVKLGDKHFAKVKDFLSRFANMPDILELDHLTVSGDVTFGRGVRLKGTVIIIANHGDRIDIPSGAILENKIVSGNMRILDH